MKEYQLKYGCNPNQTPARVFMEKGELPFEVLSGRPGYINLLDALNSWQLVKELSEALKIPAAASFKHVSPAGAAIGKPLSKIQKKACFVDDIDGLDNSPIACAYARARGADRMSSFGEWIALSDTCDEVVAKIISREVSDGIIAPSYTREALDILKKKKKGAFPIIKMDKDYEPEQMEKKQVFGITFEQRRNDTKVNSDILKNQIVTKNRNLPENAVVDMTVALITLKYTQSNSVCFAYDGQTIGVGAGQQSRIHCTRIAADKADNWHLRMHPAIINLDFASHVTRAEKNNIIDEIIINDDLEISKLLPFFNAMPQILTPKQKKLYLEQMRGAVIASDAFFPFEDNIERAFKSGADFVVQPGGSMRDDKIIEACDARRMVMVFTGTRLFHH